MEALKNFAACVVVALLLLVVCGALDKHDSQVCVGTFQTKYGDTVQFSGKVAEVTPD